MESTRSCSRAACIKASRLCRRVSGFDDRKPRATLDRTASVSVLLWTSAISATPDVLLPVVEGRVDISDLPAAVEVAAPLPVKVDGLRAVTVRHRVARSRIDHPPSIDRSAHHRPARSGVVPGPLRPAARPVPRPTAHRGGPDARGWGHLKEIQDSLAHSSYNLTASAYTSVLQGLKKTTAEMTTKLHPTAQPPEGGEEHVQQTPVAGCHPTLSGDSPAMSPRVSGRSSTLASPRRACGRCPPQGDGP